MRDTDLEFLLSLVRKYAPIAAMSEAEWQRFRKIKS